MDPAFIANLLLNLPADQRDFCVEKLPALDFAQLAQCVGAGQLTRQDLSQAIKEAMENPANPVSRQT